MSMERDELGETYYGETLYAISLEELGNLPTSSGVKDSPCVAGEESESEMDEPEERESVAIPDDGEIQHAARLVELPGIISGISLSEGLNSMTTDGISLSEGLNSMTTDGISLSKGLKSVTTHEKQVLRCKLYLSLFFRDREFDKDSMVQLWMADGIFEPEIEERMEILGGEIFDSLVEMKLVLPSRFDNVYGLKYRFNKKVNSLVEFPDQISEMILPSDDDYLVVHEAQLRSTSKLTKHLSIICESFDRCTLEVLTYFKDLRTLILFCRNGTSINHVPDDLFLYFKHLRTLDLHEFAIFELPRSIGKLKSLMYFDVSGTPIEYLPESIDSLDSLQTLKLK